MDAVACREALIQMQEYTVDVQRFLGVNPTGKSKNSHGRFVEKQPSGAVTHYTASNAAVGKDRPYGRLPVILERFRPRGDQGVGVQFVVWDDVVPRFDEIRRHYPLLASTPSEMFCFGFDEAYFHAGWANSWAYGIEIRNVGQVQRRSDGTFYWHRGQERYRGRAPIRVGSSWWEPFTWSQIVGTLWIHRLMAAVYDIQPERFLGHTHLTSTRIDPGKHFPIHEMREFALFKADWPLLQCPFLHEFAARRDSGAEQGAVEDPMVSETALHRGLYRDDWDGVPLDFDFTKDIRSRTDLNSNDVAWAKSQLQSVGYYVGDPGPDPNPAFLETLCIFQARWKKAKAGKPDMVQAMAVSGDLDVKTVKLIKDYVKMWDTL